MDKIIEAMALAALEIAVEAVSKRSTFGLSDPEKARAACLLKPRCTAEARAALSALLKATNLTEDQLRGLAEETCVVVPVEPTEKAQRDAENRAWDDAREAMLNAYERRKKLAAKEG